MSAEQEQSNGDHEQELFGRCILIPVVDLLPHVEVVVGPRIEIERYAADVVEHEVRPGHI